MKKFAVSVTVLTAVVLGATIAGCTPKLDDKKVVDAITTGLKGLGFPVKSVTCPESHPVKKDDVFTCKATFDGGQTTDVTVTQKNDDGDVSWKVKGIVSGKAVGDQLTKTAPDGSEVTCKEDVITATKGSKTTCSAKKGEKTSELEVTFTNDDGAFDTVYK